MLNIIVIFNEYQLTREHTRFSSVPSGKTASMLGKVGEEAKDTRV